MKLTIVQFKCVDCHSWQVFAKDFQPTWLFVSGELSTFNQLVLVQCSLFKLFRFPNCIMFIMTDIFIDVWMTFFFCSSNEKCR